MAGIVDGGKVVALPKGVDDQARRTIEILEDALAFARENPCWGVSIFLMGRDDMNHYFDGTSSRSQAVGALALMQYQMMAGD